MTKPRFNLVFPTRKKGKTHKATATLLPPKETPDSYIDRDKWFAQVIAGFVSKSASNRKYYEIILRTVWPEGHGIPGPHIDQRQIREAINAYRGKPYVDTFRRVRELEGEEGIRGLIKQGTTYQLIDLTVSPKRTPRTSLGKQDWVQVLTMYNFKCAVCQGTTDERGFQQDHKIPRARGGSDSLDNWQPLCDECNILKSVACRNCERDCKTCCWAFPESFKPLFLPSETLQKLHKYAAAHFKTPEDIITAFVRSLK